MARYLAVFVSLVLFGACSSAPDAPASPTGADAPPATVAAAGTSVAAVEPATAESVSTTTLRAASVSRVVDGDTIDVLIDGVEHRIRLILIDTPEVFGGVECYGAEASAFVKALLPVGAAVALERDVSETDRFGRLLRYVYLPDGRMLNEVIVLGGYARVATYPPDVKYLDRMRAAQETARATGAGLWGACTSSPAPAATPAAPRTNCDPSYPTVCIPPPPPDLDCGEITASRFAVLPPDPHGFDGDRDGVGCES